MASLATLRSLVYKYLGTTASDPAFPTDTVDALINAAGNKYIAELHQGNPSYLSKTTTLTSSTRAYTLPADFAGYLEVRLEDDQGTLLDECRLEELGQYWSEEAFAISGADGAATLTTSRGVREGVALFLRYRYSPAELVNTTDAPTWMPSKFHDLLAREAAVDGFGLGGEQLPSGAFLEELMDRRAIYWSAVGRRGVQATKVRP